MKELKATLDVFHGALDRLDQVLQDVGEAVAELRESGDQR